MSKKPIKKTDQSKEWIARRKDRKIKSQLEYHLIVCEGTKTEPNYFIGIKEDISKENKEKLTVSVLGKGRGTTNLLEEALKEVRKSANYISDVWIVYDKDDFTEESFNEVEKQCKELNEQSETTYHAIWSNPCIEIWVLLHFIRIETPIDCKTCIKKINEIFKKGKLKEYTKNDKKLYEKLKPYLNTALENAKWLEDRYNDDKLPSKMNPCTKVHKLVELLSKYIEK